MIYAWSRAPQRVKEGALKSNFSFFLEFAPLLYKMSKSEEKLTKWAKLIGENLLIYFRFSIVSFYNLKKKKISFTIFGSSVFFFFFLFFILWENQFWAPNNLILRHCPPRPPSRHVHSSSYEYMHICIIFVYLHQAEDNLIYFSLYSVW